MAWEVLILGGGFGGFNVARRLERKLPAHAARLRVVNDANFMLYTPLLPGAAGGTLQSRQVVVPLREELDPDTDLRVAKVLSADPERKQVWLRPLEGEDYELRYDKLIVALGSSSRVFDVPGLRDHAVGFKTLGEAVALRNRLIQSLEKAETLDEPHRQEPLLTFVVVGAGYAGLEGLAELQDYASEVIERYPRCRLHGLRFMLVEARDRIMSEIEPALAEFAAAELRRRGIEIRTNTTVERVSADSLELSTGEVIPTRTVCWTAGVQPPPVVRRLGLPTDRTGRIVTDATCRVEGLPDVFAIGDVAAVPDPARPGSPCPPTAQHAIRQARVAADNVARSLAAGGGGDRRFTYKTLGVFVDMGRFQAVASTVGIKWRGRPAWFLARSYHLAQMPGGKRKIRLMIDWSVELLMGRASAEASALQERSSLLVEDEPGPAEVAAGSPPGAA